jgi:hypothetical protein
MEESAMRTANGEAPALATHAGNGLAALCWTGSSNGNSVHPTTIRVRGATPPPDAPGSPVGPCPSFR